MGLDLKLGNIKEIRDPEYGGVGVLFENGMEFCIGGRWMEDGEYDDDGNFTNVCRLNVFKKEGGTGFFDLEKCEQYQKEHPEYFIELNKEYKIFGLCPEIEDMVADAVIDYFEKVPKDYKGIKIVYTDYKKGQNKTEDNTLSNSSTEGKMDYNDLRKEQGQSDNTNRVQNNPPKKAIVKKIAGNEK